MHSTCVLLYGEAWFGMKMPYFQKWGKIAHSELWISSPEGNLTNSIIEEAGSFLLAKDIVLSEWTPAPMVVCSRKQHLPFSCYDCVILRAITLHHWQRLCVLIVYRFQYLETHSACVLLCVETWFSMKMPSLHTCGKAAHGEYADHHQMTISQTQQN